MPAMVDERSYLAENDTERGRLRALVERLTDAELARPLPAGWTIASVLAHLAFWDQRALVLLERWQQTGVAPRSADEADVDWINDAAKPLCLALPPRAAAHVALATAEAIDGKVRALRPELAKAATAPGSPVSLRRAEHRRAHLDEIERSLGR
jgi:mycothiol maleylpyruvate isomerase-like protein